MSERELNLELLRRGIGAQIREHIYPDTMNPLTIEEERTQMAQSVADSFIARLEQDLAAGEQR